MKPPDATADFDETGSHAMTDVRRADAQRIGEKSSLIASRMGGEERQTPDGPEHVSIASDRLEALLRVSQSVLAEKTFEGLLRKVVEAAGQLTRARIGIAGSGYAEGVFRMETVSNVADSPGSSARSFRIEHGGACLELFRSFSTFRLTDVELLGFPAWKELLEGHAPLRGLLGARLVDGEGSPCGMLLASDKEEGDFTEEDEAVLAQLSTIASLGLQRVKQLQDAESKTSAIEATISSLTDGMVIYGPSGDIQRINPSAAAILDYSPAELALPLAERVATRIMTTPRGNPISVRGLPVSRALNGEIVRDMSVLISKDERRKPAAVSASAAPIRSPDGSMLGAVMVLKDVTREKDLEAQREDLLKTLKSERAALQKTNEHLVERARSLTSKEAALKTAKEELEERVGRRTEELATANAALHEENAERAKAERLLQEHNALLENIFGSVTFQIAYLDARFNFIRVNRAYAEAEDQDIEHLVGKNLFSLHPSEEGQALFRRVIASGEAWYAFGSNVAWIGQTGAEAAFWDIGLRPVKNSLGQATGLVLSLVDVTERKRAERALQASEERFRTLVDNLPVGICRATVGSGGRFLACNPAFLQMLGFDSIDELNERNVASIYPSPEARQTFIDAVMRRDSVTNVNITLVKKTGEYIKCIINSKLTRDDAGVPAFLDSEVEDVTRQLKIEAERIALLHSLDKRVKELSTLIKASTLLRDSRKPLEEIFRSLVDILPEGFSVPHNIAARIVYEGRQYETENFAAGSTAIVLPFGQGDDVGGTLEVAYLDDGGESSSPLMEEQRLVHSLSEILGLYLEGKLAQERIIRSRDFYLTLFSDFPSLIWRAGADGKHDYFNKTWLNFTGRGLEEELGDGWAEGIHPEDREERISAYRRAFDRREPFSMAYRLRRHGGEYRWIMDFGRPFRNIDGEFAGYIGACFDFTERKAAEDGLRESEERYSSIFENSQSVMMLLEPETGAIVDANASASAFYGYDRQTLRSMTVYDLNMLTADELAREMTHAKRRSRSYFHFKHRLADGSIRDVEVYSGPIASQGKRLLYSIVHDITRRKIAEAGLKKAHQEIKSLLAAVPSVLIGVDNEDVVKQWNGVAEKTFGLMAGDVRGKKLFDCDIQWTWPEIMKALSGCRESGAPVRIENVFCSPTEGKCSSQLVTLNPIQGDGGMIAGVIILADDVTERKIMEQQLAQAQKLESIGQLAAGVAHEINTPMQYVGDNTRFLQESFSEFLGLLDGYGELAAKALTTPDLSPDAKAILEAEQRIDTAYLKEEIPRAIEQSLEGIGRITKIVTSMKTFSHPGNSQKTFFDVNSALESTVTISKHEWKYVANVVVDYDASLPPIPCFPEELNQAFLNIIVNAAHAISGVNTGAPHSMGTIAVATKLDGDFAEVRISDTGTGIPEAIRSRIFDPFFTTKEVGKGTGQGLAIAHAAIVKKHGGTLLFETEEGKGTTFIIRLPVSGVDNQSAGQARTGGPDAPARATPAVPPEVEA